MNRRVTFAILGIGACLFAIALMLVLGGTFFLSRDTTPSVTILPSTPATLLSPQEYSQSARDLTQAVTELNAAELRFLQDAEVGTPVDSLRLDLQEVAARAMNVSMIASRLGNTAASQQGASEPAMQLASQYFAISRYGAALVIEAQNARIGLASGATTPEQASALIAQYSARLWTPAFIDADSPGNPFGDYLGGTVIPQAQYLASDQLTSQIGAAPEVWMSASQEMVTVNLNVPGSSTPVTSALYDADSFARMLTAQGQADANAAQQLASAIINAGGDTNVLSGTPPGGVVVASFWSAMAMSVSAEGNLPTFPNGSASVLSRAPASQDIVSTILLLGQDNTPTVQTQVPITQTNPLVALTISNLVVKQVSQRPKDSFTTFEAEVTYEFDVQWQTGINNPVLELDCVSGNHFEITSNSGTKHISAKGLLILFPGAEDAYCYASRNGNTLGSVTLRFLVGDPVGATQRVLQVETDSVALNFTLTADALGTQAANLNNAVASQSVIGTSNAVATEVYGTQNAEFLLTVTTIARQTQLAVPVATETPSATPTFVPVVFESLYIRGDQAAISSVKPLQSGRLYQICFSGYVYLTTGPVAAYELMHVNGISVPVSGCMTIEGNGAPVAITCGHGTSAEEPGGYSIIIMDLGPW